MYDISGSELPKNIVLTEGGAVRYYWRKRLEAILMVFLGVLIFIPSILTTNDVHGFVPESLLCSLPISWIPGLTLLYFGVRKGVNYTELRVEDGQLLIRHKPIPWRDNKSIPAMDVERLSVFLRRKDVGGEDRVVEVLTCDVAVIVKNGDKIMIASDVRPETAIAIVREGERILGKPHQLDMEKLMAVFKQEEIRTNTQAAKNMPYMFAAFFLGGIYALYLGLNILGYIMLAAGLIGIPIMIRMRKRNSEGNDKNSS